MAHEEEKQKISEFLINTFPIINIPRVARLLSCSTYKAMFLIQDLECEGFLRRRENKSEKNIVRYWELNKEEEDEDDNKRTNPTI